MHEPDKRTPYNPGTRFGDKLRKVRTRTYTKNQFPWLPFQSVSRKSLSNKKEIENSTKVDSGHGGLLSNHPTVVNVPDRGTSIPGKDDTNGSVTHAPPPVVSQNELAVPPVSRSEDSSFKPLVKASSVVERSKQSEFRVPFTFRGTQHPHLHRCVKPGLGAHLDTMTIGCSWTMKEKSLHINVLELKAVFLALKSFQDFIQNKRQATDNATVVSY